MTYAFLEYNHYPYFFGCRAEKGPDAKGRFLTGLGWIKPVLVLPDAEGAALCATLKELSEEHRLAEEALQQSFIDKARAVLPPALHPKET